MKRYIFIISLISLINPRQPMAQNTNSYPFTPRAYGHIATYIVNPDYVVAIFDNKRTVLHPDIATFHILPHSDGRVAVDKNGVYHKDTFVEINPQDVSVVGYFGTYNGNRSTSTYLWKTSTRVYCGTEPIADADATTFRPVSSFNGPYYCDRYAVYYQGQRVEGADPNTFRSETTVAFDHRHVYAGIEIFTRNGLEVVPVNGTFYKTATTVYQSNISIGNERGIAREYMDAATLTALSDDFTVDKNHVYYREEVVPVNKADFPNLKAMPDAFLSDGKQVYRFNEPMKQFDARSFAVVRKGRYVVRDKNGVYQYSYNERRFKRIPFAYRTVPDTSNIRVALHGNHVIYGNQVYDPERKKVYTLTPADVETVYNGHRVAIEQEPGRKPTVEASDHETFFEVAFRNAGPRYRNEPVETDTAIDQASFKQVSWNFYRDKHTLFYLRETYEKKPAAVQPDKNGNYPVVEPWMAEETITKYHLDKVEGINLEQLRFYGYYVTDGKRLFLGTKPVEGLDAGKLRFYGLAFVTDGKQLFFGTELISQAEGDGLVLEAIFPGYSSRYSGDGEQAPGEMYYLFRNSKGYLLVDLCSGSPICTYAESMKF